MNRAETLETWILVKTTLLAPTTVFAHNPPVWRLFPCATCNVVSVLTILENFDIKERIDRMAIHSDKQSRKKKSKVR